MKALILTAHGVEDCELFYPYYRFKEENIEVDVASPDGQKVLGEHGYSLEANLSFADASAEDYDLLFLPGGRGRRRSACSRRPSRSPNGCSNRTRSSPRSATVPRC